MGDKALAEVPSRLQRGVIMLGIVSLFMDMSSELIHSLLPALFVTVLGANMATIDIIEGIAEATASVTRVFSGALSDWLGKWCRAFRTLSSSNSKTGTSPSPGHPRRRPHRLVPIM